MLAYYHMKIYTLLQRVEGVIALSDLDCFINIFVGATNLNFYMEIPKKKMWACFFKICITLPLLSDHF
jgi:hypothetical protein